MVRPAMWLPDLGDISGRRYKATAMALAQDAAAGRLLPGDRLPTHRDLAWRLGHNFSTVGAA